MSPRRAQRARTIGSVLRSASSLIVLGIAVVMVLAEFGVALGPILASAGIVGVALGFGAQTLVRDFLSGMFMLLEDQYGVGDRIDAGEATGTVVEIGLRVTTLRGENGELWYVRNGEIKRVANLSQGWATAQLDIEVRADADYDGLPDPLELSLGTHPKVKDSDGDGLGDGDEAAHLAGATDPTVLDSDGDGTDDATEDSDGDTLTNADEIAAGTNPLSPDADADTLTDPAELAAGTGPGTPDTDGDGLLDEGREHPWR